MLSALIATHLPELAALLERHDIELSLITVNWFLTVFASVLHTRILLRVWDLFFYRGSLVVFQVALGMLRIKGGPAGGVRGTQAGDTVLFRPGCMVGRCVPGSSRWRWACS